MVDRSGGKLAYFAIEYTIHFDDTMAYGSHHFLTAFKFQCAARESFLFGERVFDVPGVREALDDIHLFTADAYARNLNPARLGDRVAILLTLEEWGRVSARFCYRAISEMGQPICAGFQTLICADARTGDPIPMPSPLRQAMDTMRAITEHSVERSFRDQVLAGARATEALFTDVARKTAVKYLAERYPRPSLVPAIGQSVSPVENAFTDTKALERSAAHSVETEEAWFFAGQASFDPQLLSERVVAYAQRQSSARTELDQCAVVAQELIGGDATAVVSGSPERCDVACRTTPELLQFAIHLQNVLGALWKQSQGYDSAFLVGHSFGEIAALGVAGCFDVITGVRIVCERIRAVAKYGPPDGEMLVATTNRQIVMTEAAVLGLDQVVVAGRNHDKQTVVSGPLSQLDRLSVHLRDIGHDAIKIASQTSFHHPLLRPAAMAWLERLRTLPITGPSRTVYSPNARRFIMPDDDITEVLASQLMRPFDLQSGIADLVDAGATRFVDCGSSGSLARLISKAGRDHLDVCAIGRLKPDTSPTGSPNRPTIADRASDATRPTSRNGNHRTRREAGNTAVHRPTGPAVAILGRGCVLPGGVRSPEQLFSAITEKRNGIVDQRDSDPHWSEDFYSEELAPDRSTSPLSGLVDPTDISAPAGVDPSVFNEFTPTQRLLCIALAPCVASLEGAERILCLIGATADGFEDQDNVSSLRYAGINPADPEVDGRMNTAASAFQEPHAAVQEVFDRVVRPGLEITLVDAACASSLYAAALGMQALQSYDADAVIAGGVFCPGPGNSCLFSQFGGTTSTGCRPFDANADGVVFSEGAALVTLRRVADAERLGLKISALLRGAGLSSDGKSSSANVPQTKGQILSLKRCYANHDIDPASVQAIEAHGTSTPVGDSTELETLRQFFADCSTNPIPVHSLKGLLGHAGWAAGTTSIIAASEYLRHGVFPAQAHHTEPSGALMKSAETLIVPTRPIALPPGQRRIAIDGFGFGGANAHIVLDSYVPSVSPGTADQVSPTAKVEKEELVFIACHELLPMLPSSSGLCFDRDNMHLSQGHILLPDLADDIDISQTLAISVVAETIAQIPQFDNELRQRTSVVLALSGKTERGVEATTRVLAPRFRRRLAELGQPIVSLETAVNNARPSGPYTLQCMMPNVAAGRAALQLNLNGPNFVVDAGSNSLEAAVSSAALLLGSGDEGGTKLVVVTAINANPWRVPSHMSRDPEREYAAAFAVTTRDYADRSGLKILAGVEETWQTACRADEVDQREATTAVKVDSLLMAIAARAADPDKPTATTSIAATLSTESEYQIHAPVWVEIPSAKRPKKSADIHPKAFLAIVPPDQEHIDELVARLPNHSQRYMVAVACPTGTEFLRHAHNPNVVAVDLTNEQATESALDEIDVFGADVIVVIDSKESWDIFESLTKVATDNSLCELLFLVAQRSVPRLAQGATELWGLFPNGWNGVVHPATGSIAGLLKAVHREIPAARTGLICTRDLSLVRNLRRLHIERCQSNHEQEIVYDDGKRLARRLRPTAPCHSTTHPRVALDADSVVIATGGARGVTAILLEALLRDYQCTVVAIGRSHLEAGPANTDAVELERDFYEQFMRDNPNASPLEMKKSFESSRARWEAHRTIEKLASLGGHVEYVVADITDPAQVASVVQRVASQFGRVDLVVHGAGVQWSKRLEHRSLTEFRRTFAVKVAGLHNIVDCCRRQFNKTVPVHALTSAYSIFGNDGQHDYGAANETLDRICGLTRIHAECDWTSIAWLAWDGVGMTRGSEYRALAKQRGLSGMDAESGQRIFRDVLLGRTNSPTNVPLTHMEHATYEVKALPRPTSVETGRICETVVQLAEIECLPYHRVRGIPTVPGAWILERMVRTALCFVENVSSVSAVTIEDVDFSRFIRLANDREPNIRIVAEETSNGIYVWTIGDVLHSSGVALSKDLVFASAKVSFTGESEILQATLNGIDAGKGNGSIRSISDPYCSGERDDVELSGPFDCVRDIKIGPSGRLAKFVPDQTCLWPGVIPALLLDAAWRVGAMDAIPEQDELYVPVHIDRLVVPVGMSASSDLASGWQIRTTAPRVQDGNVRWDRTEVLSRSGAVKMLVTDTFAMRLQ